MTPLILPILLLSDSLSTAIAGIGETARVLLHDTSPTRVGDPHQQQ